jgi:hypothetical protein
MSGLHRLLLRWSCILGSALLAGPPALAASKALVAAVGDGAPGGGVFAGPGFADWPTAAGNGWVAFRGEIVGGTTSETLVVARMTSPGTRTRVASLGEAAPSGGIFGECAGKLKEFVGHPAVNASGDVAFMALIQPVSDAGQAAAAIGPRRAGIFALRGGVLAPVACSGQITPGGTLDLAGPFAASTSAETEDTPERSPAINDAGDVAFVTAYVNADGAPSGGAVVLAPRAGGFLEAARIDAPFDGGRLVRLGPPALNNHGLLAFHAVATTTDPTDSDGMVDGIFAADGQALRVLVRDGLSPMPLDQKLVQFEDPVSLNDQGDVAFLAGPLVDPADQSTSPDATPGVLVCRAQVVTLVAYPGQQIDSHVVTGVALGPFGGSVLPTPSIAPDGSVAFFVSLNDGTAEAIAAWDGESVRALLYTGGKIAGASPSGGVYAGAESAPALDAAGGIAFRAHLVGGSSSEAVVYIRPDGTATSIALGEAAPRQNEGFFGGRAFSAPRLTDGGDVVFRAYVVRGPTSVGIFRWRNGQLEAIVRAGDLSPSGQPFLDLVGQPSVNQRGGVVFAAQVENEGRGIFVADARGIRKVVRRGDRAPGDDGTTFSGFGPNPQINETGTVAFRGTTSFRDPATSDTIRREGIFVRGDAGIEALVYAESPSPVGIPFLKVRDPLLTAAASVVFRAPLGELVEQSSGIFAADDRQMSRLAIQQQPLGVGIVLSGFSGTPVVTPSGQIAFLGTRAMPDPDPAAPVRSLGAAILKSSRTGLDLVVARDMPAPAGGTFKTLGQPAINGAGTIAFRGSVQSAGGRTSGLFLQLATGLVPFLLRGEGSPIGGRLDTFASQISVNALDEIAFTASVSGGKASDAIFLASPTVLKTRGLGLRLTGGRGRDRVALRAVLEPGRVSAGVNPASEPVTVSLRDADGLLWSATVGAGRLKARGRTFVTKLSRRNSLRTQLRLLRIQIDRRGGVHFTAVSGAVDLTQGGTRTLAAPFTVGCEVGDDGAMAYAVPRVVRARGPRGA